MNSKLMRNLEKCFWFLGWFTLLMAIAYVPGRIYAELSASSHSSSFPLLEELQSLFGSLGHAFFFLLLARVFAMVILGAPKGSPQAYRLMQVTCASYVAKTLFSVLALLSVNYRFEGALLSRAVLGMSIGFTFFESLMPLFYAASIYALFRRFSEMITFESEVA